MRLTDRQISRRRETHWQVRIEREADRQHTETHTQHAGRDKQTDGKRETDRLTERHRKT